MTKLLNNADVTGYISQTSVTSSLLKTDSSGKLVAATAGTDYATPGTIASADKLIREVYNKTGATLTKGTVVYINDGQGNLPAVTKAIATGDSTSAQTFGVVQADITSNNNGYVVVVGGLDNMNTNGLGVGTQLYLSSTTAGEYTTTKQYAPNHLVYVGVVVRDHPTQGVIEIRIQNGYEMDELHNVSAQTPSNNDGIFWESSTSLWKNKSIATILGYTPEQPLTFSSPLVRTTNTISIPAATGSINGYLSSTDWTTFNNKQNALSGTGFVKISGTTISYDNSTYLTTSAAASTYVPYTGATTGVNLGGNNITAAYGILTGVGTNQAGVLSLFKGTIRAVQGNGYTNIYAEDGKVGFTDWITGNVRTFEFSLASLTAGLTRTFTLPNASGTLALTGDLSSYVPYTGATANVTLGAYTLTATSLIKSGGVATEILAANGSVITAGTGITISGGTISSTASAGSSARNEQTFTATAGTNTLTITGGYTVGLVDVYVNGVKYAPADFTATTSPTVVITGLISGDVIDVITYNSTVGNVAGSGTTNYVPKFTATGTIGNSIIYASSTAVGIGTSSPTTNTQIAGANGVTDSYGQLFVSTTNTATQDFGGQLTLGGYYNGTSNQTAFGAIAGRKENSTANNALGYLSFSTQNGTITERMRITSGGIVLINTTSSSNISNLQVNGNIETRGNSTIFMLSNTGGTAQSWWIGQDVSGSNDGIFYIYNNTSGTQAINIRKNNNVLVGTTTDIGVKLHVNGNFASSGSAGSNALLSRENGNSTTYGFFNSGNGNLTVTNSGVANVGYFNMSTGAYVPTSDINKKKDFEISNIGLNEVMQLKPTLYRMKTDKSNGIKELGFIAQEVKDIIPSAYQESGDMIGLNFNPIVAALTKAVQELKSENDSLLQRLEVLENK